MSLKLKLTSLFFLTLFFALGVMGTELLRQSQRLGERQRELLESSMLAQKKAELVRAVEFLESELGAEFPAGSAPDPERAKAIIAAANAGEDGYFFLYDRDGVCLVHPRQPELVGKNLQSLVDARGRRVIPSLIETARSGGGFQHYAWKKPSTGLVTEKLGYVSLLEPWGWIVGTGVYLDDVERATRSARESSEASVKRTLREFAVVALVALLAVFLGGLGLTVTEQRLADRKLRALADRIVHLQEDERARVARDLHDGIVQVLIAARFFIEAGRQKLAREPDAGDMLLVKAVEQLDGAVADVRRIAHGLRPPTLDDLGLASALRELADETSARLGIPVTLEDRLGSVEPGEPQAVALLRVAQEALVNVERHARANQVRMALATTGAGQRVVLEVEDDGRGFDARSNQSGSGLGNMRHRVEELGGEFRIQSRPGRTEIRAEFEVAP
jgi:two-component system, NarL family, sensor kinase